MRSNIVHIGADELTYEIREIVEVGEKLESLGVKMHWENIGDPIAKGEQVPAWIKDIVKDTISNDNSCFGYSPTKGLSETRQFIADLRKKEMGVNLNSEDILFFNGLGDAISIIYTYLNRNARVIGPNPAYPTHSSAEAAHAGAHHISYTLNPHRNWLPDIEDIRNKVKYNPSVAGILIINPDNPTGMVYPRKILEEIVRIAEEFDLFIVSDEIYANISFGNEEMVSIAEVAQDKVPVIVMRGLSKEVPWPGARCGWIEVYNKDKDTMFARYIKTLVDAKQLEVCSTTLPQKVLPEIMSHPKYEEYLKEKSEVYKKKADIAYNVFRGVDGIIAPKPEGAFYMSVVFEDGVINGNQSLSIESPIRARGSAKPPEAIAQSGKAEFREEPASNGTGEKVRDYIESMTKDISSDKKFVYYLMAATGICVVPLSGFNSDLQGFRITLLEPDIDLFEKNLNTVAEKIKEYVNSK